jgi:flagellar assembly factor FliW
MKNTIKFTVVQGATELSKTIETNKQFNLNKAAHSFAGMLHNAHKQIEALKETGVKVIKPFSYHKPFSLSIDVNGVKVIDSTEANEASFLTIVLRAKQAVDSPAPLSAAIVALSEIVTLEY